MKKSLLFIVCVLLIGTSYALQTYTYLTRDTLQLQLDVYKPAHPRPDHACVVYLFGGGFYQGTRNSQQSQNICQAFADKGFVTVSIDYRLYLRQPRSKFMLLDAWMIMDTAISWAVADCSEAIAYLCHHASQLSIDPSRIILTGSSAGAITVLQTDYCRANSMPQAAALPEGFKPAAVIPYAGAILCPTNSFRYLTPPAPTCFFHGTADKIVNYDGLVCSFGIMLYGSNRLAKLFQEKNYSYWILRYKDRGHEMAPAQPYTIDIFCAFVDALFENRLMQCDATCVDKRIPRTFWSGKTLIDLYAGFKI